jgi:hypothetical protein
MSDTKFQPQQIFSYFRSEGLIAQMYAICADTHGDMSSVMNTQPPVMKDLPRGPGELKHLPVRERWFAQEHATGASGFNIRELS